MSGEANSYQGGQASSYQGGDQQSQGNNNNLLINIERVGNRK